MLPFIPRTAIDTVDLIAPSSVRPRGINMLQLTTDLPSEREQVADQLAEVVDRLHPATSDLMREAIRLGTLAVLEYGVATRREVSLLDLYIFFSQEDRREEMLRHIKVPPVRQAFASESINSKTLEAVQRQIRRLVSSRAVILSLCRTGPNQIDLRQAMSQGRRVVVDASDADLGPGQAALINEVVASKLQLYTANRKSQEPGFGVVADEVQEYQGAGHSFRRALALAAEYRVAWVLINQYREGQLNSAMQAAVSLAGTQVFFRLAQADALQAVKTLAHQVTAEELVRLPKRDYWTAERHGGHLRLGRRTTLDLPKADLDTAREIRRRNEHGPTADAVLTSAYRALGSVQGVGLWS